MEKVSFLVRKSVIFLIILYRYLISPWLGQRCRFYPSCSQYSQTALAQFGMLWASYLILKRLLRCHPLHPGGYDPVPETGSEGMLGKK